MTGEIRYNFEKVKCYAKKSGKCLCGKRRTRSEVLWQTVNPFNKNPDGTVKTYNQVRADVNREYEEWKSKPITCSDCENSSGLGRVEGAKE